MHSHLTSRSLLRPLILKTWHEKKDLGVSVASQQLFTFYTDKPLDLALLFDRKSLLILACLLILKFCQVKYCFLCSGMKDQMIALLMFVGFLPVWLLSDILWCLVK
jgi:hypothetical protein